MRSSVFGSFGLFGLVVSPDADIKLEVRQLICAGAYHMAPEKTKIVRCPDSCLPLANILCHHRSLTPPQRMETLTNELESD